ncbi:MAG: glycoside hydrolase family 9 protein [Prolixibacteraceae bacterium]|nr:glycoside hydrolase family 9 protein [Prolixibacteraceae bacterium]
MKKIFFSFALILSVFLTAKSQELKINEDEYFEMPGLNVMVFYDIYPEGHQGAVGIIQNGTRVATNGDIRLEPTPGQWQPIPKVGKREVFPETNEISVPLSFPDESKNAKGFNPIYYPDLDFSYNVRVFGEGKNFRIIVDLEQPLPEEWIGKVGFNLELFPGLFFGKSWYMDDESGIFPLQANGPMQKDADGNWQAFPIASGKQLTIAPDVPELTMVIKSEKEELQLLDGRFYHNNGWFVVRSEVPAGATKGAIEWIIKPNIVEGFKQNPVIHVSQVGYHTNQDKTATVELDKSENNILQVEILRMSENGGKEVVKKGQPELWGKYLRFNYYQIDFSDIQKPGIYQVKYGDYFTEPFKIDDNVYERHVWQPTLEYFLPVQMCHMRINEGYRVWHDLCHMDDALMAPVDTNHFDGYIQGASTLNDYDPLDQVPGLNIGGWHDAGDYDLRVESQAGTVWTLAMAYEEFGIDWDQTTIDQENHLVEIHLPDGKPDALQQIEHGVLAILGGYENAGLNFRGIICNSLRQYVLLGDASSMTDNLKYNPELGKNEKTGTESGIHDDRWVFTQENSGRIYGSVKALAAASRVLKGYNDELAERCLKIAIWLYDADKQENRFGASAKIDAAAELLITTNDERYQKDILGFKDNIGRSVSRSASALARIFDKCKDDEFKAAALEGFKQLSEQIGDQRKQNPFGVPYTIKIWGDGWNIQEFGMRQYFLHKAFPELFDKEVMLNALNFVLGNHPGENTSSFASGVGSRSITEAYGVNRADRSFIPGGVVSGTGIIRPDFPELKEWPFFWQQTEYVMGGGATNFMFLVLAANQLLKE